MVILLLLLNSKDLLSRGYYEEVMENIKDAILLHLEFIQSILKDADLTIEKFKELL